MVQHYLKADRQSVAVRFFKINLQRGEAGSLVIEKLSECQKVCFVPRGSQMQDLTQPQHINTMLYEAELFATLVDEHLVDHPGLAVSRITAKLLTEIRRQTGVIFPADSVKL